MGDGANDGVVFDGFTFDSTDGIIVSLGFFVVGFYLFVELIQYFFILLVPIGLLRIIIAGAWSIHGFDTQFFKNGIIVVIVWCFFAY